MPSKKRRYRKKFTGKRDDTENDETISPTPLHRYIKRKDGTLYPERTTISLTFPTKDIFAIMREAGKFDNYDELMINIVEHLIMYNKVSGKILETVNNRITIAKTNIKIMKNARWKAKGKLRYSRRKTGISATTL